MRLCDLKRMEVINACDCKRLGFISDIDFDLCTGNIYAIIVPGPGKCCGLFPGDSELVISIRCIKQIGHDIVLVDVDEKAITRKCRF